MALVALTSLKGAPGVTTAALAMIINWPSERPVVLVEADPAGGDVAARFGLSPDPGLASLATGLRHTRSIAPGGALMQHSQPLPGGVRVIVEPVSRTEAHSALEIVADSLAELARAEGVDVVVDCGRVDAADRADNAGRAAASPLARLRSHADLLLLVTVGELADLGHVHDLLPSLHSGDGNVGIVVRAPQVWSSDEIERALQVAVVGALPFDTVAADLLAGRQHSRRAARLPLFRAAAAMVDRVVDRAGAVMPAAAHPTEPIVATPVLTPEAAVQ